MSDPRVPRPRRRQELLDELVARARVWLPEWQPRHGGNDFAQALFEIAARLGSEVTQRLDRVPEKNRRAFMQWLGVGGAAARAARLPLVFGMTPGSEPVDAQPRVQLQALGVEPPVMLETEQGLRILPARLVSLVAADPQGDRFFVAPARTLASEAPRPLPDEWNVSAFGDNGQVQFAQSIGIEPGLVLLDQGHVQHEVVKVENGIVTLVPPLEPSAGSRVTRALAFDAFDAGQIDRQRHALYIGADHALDIPTAAVIEVASQGVIDPDAVWEYWGKDNAKDKDASAPPTWHRFEDAVRQDGRLLLVKQEGSIEPYEVGGRKQRWLRARLQSNVPPAPAEVAAIALTINCAPVVKPWPAAAAERLQNVVKAAPAKIVREGIANTAPLVLDQPFYPLGREPRLFDAFYLGSKEVFSKPAALATVTFVMGDQFGGALAAAKLADAHLVVAIGNDGRLQRLRVPDASRLPVFEQGTQPAGEGGKPIALQAGLRPGAASFGGKAYATALESGRPGEQPVWLFVEPPAQPGSEWQSLGVPPTQDRCTDTLLVSTRNLGALRAYAVAGGRLYRRDAPSASGWEQVGPSHAGRAVDVAKVVPIAAATAAAGSQDEADGLLCVSADGELFCQDGAAWKKVNDPKHRLDPAVYPLAVRVSSRDVLCVGRLQAAADGRAGRLVALPLQAPHEAKEIEADLVGDAFGFAVSADAAGDPSLIVLFVTEAQGEKRPAHWQPFPDNHVIVGPAPGGPKAMLGAPVAIGPAHVVPAENGTVYVSAFDPQRWQSVQAATVTDGLIFSGLPAAEAAQSLVIEITAGGAVETVAPTADTLIALRDDVHLLIRPQRGKRPVTSIAAYRLLHRGTRSGHLLEPTRVQLQSDEHEVVEGMTLQIVKGRKARVHLVEKVEREDGGPPVAVLKGALPGSAGTKINYRAVKPLGTFSGETKPVVDVHDLRGNVLDVLAQGRMYFPALRPQVQVPLHVLPDLHRVVLSEPWDPLPDDATKQFAFVADAASTPWVPYGPARPRNPELSWEYWNGSGWWQIKGVSDETANLVNSGDVRFCVPADLKPVDVVGRANHWVRARLVGGDYGQESVTIESTRVPATATSRETTTQKIVRSADSIRAPFVVSMTLSYEVCCPVTPEVVLAEDSAAMVDLSGANRTPGAKVPHFIRLSRSLAALQRASAPTAADPTLPPDGGKALYLGFDKPLEGEPISLLFLVIEGTHAGAYPLQLEVLRRNGFERVVVEDNTRGLNESGTLSFALSEPPLFSQLFGASGYWLRVRPSARFDGADWRPVIRGAWLNGTWASAAETRLLELLGSSDGSPRQRVVLAQPPVILDSLEVRVRERLGEEDKDMLRRADPDAVEERLGPRVGPWVRWTLVDDTDDAEPDERVYSLDEETGEISFGDGSHGKIPPIGADAILARSYRHGAGRAANGVAAWSQINLVTPLAGVDSVIAPDGAAGGSDPQDAATTLRFAPDKVFARDRALTLRDIEVLALQFSPDIAQVSARSAPPGVRVVVVMRGRAPTPSAAVCRELRSFLLDRAPPALGADGALAIVGPAVLPLQVSLQLVIDRIEHSGAVSAETGRRVRALLDPATGGLDELGWPLGRAPSKDEIVAQLADMPHLAEVGGVSLHAVSPEGARVAVPERLAPTQLAQVAADGVRCDVRLPASEITG